MPFSGGSEDVSLSVQLAAESMDKRTSATKVEEKIAAEGKGKQEVDEDIRRSHRRVQEDGQRIRGLEVKVLETK